MIKRTHSIDYSEFRRWLVNLSVNICYATMQVVVESYVNGIREIVESDWLCQTLAYMTLIILSIEMQLIVIGTCDSPALFFFIYNWSKLI